MRPTYCVLWLPSASSRALAVTQEAVAIRRRLTAGARPQEVQRKVL
jgi:hypothetical protein